ncbi:MAG: hypothetical protein NVS1B11_21550 [Terriglobales bacterium]
MTLPKKSKGVSLSAALAQNKRSCSRKYLLRLFVTGTSARSSQSIMNLRAFCEKHLRDQCNMEVIDIYQQPSLAREQIIATPTLIKKLPLPVRILVGDFSDQRRMASGLDVSLTNT